MKIYPSEDIKLFLRIEPDISTLTHQNGVEPVHRGGKTFIHKTRELKNLEAFYVSHLKKFAPEKPWKCPIYLKTAWYFRRPKDKKGKLKTTNPDTDNLVKTLKDCMKKAGFFVDDALVAIELISKFWVDDDSPHGIEICMKDFSWVTEND
jgi:Holliday junction resolvase RusA-like endonuclease